MIDTILATKQKMGQTFVGDTRVPVTYVNAGPCIVTQVKTEDKDGYWAVQLGFGERRIKNITKPELGHLKGALENQKSKIKNQNKAPRFVREVRLNKEPDLKVGDQIKVSEIFKKGDVVNVVGVSKGKGFAGAIKRWGFAMQGRTHGQSDRLRAPGSIGAMGIGRVWKGKKMAGRMGSAKTTIKNLTVVDVDDEKGMLTISGSVPGVPGGLLIVTKIASGKLEELEQTAVQPQIVEGEPEGEESGESKEGQEKSEEPKVDNEKEA